MYQNRKDVVDDGVDDGVDAGVDDDGAYDVVDAGVDGGVNDGIDRIQIICGGAHLLIYGQVRTKLKYARTKSECI